MASNLVWITGALSGIGGALARSVPWTGSRVIGIGRRPVDSGDENGSIVDLRARLAAAGKLGALS